MTKKTELNTGLTIISNTRLTTDIYEMRLTGDVSRITSPGQFINISLDKFFLRRPISVCEWNESGELTLIYKVVGKGTEYMSTLTKGYQMDCLMGLGNGFNTMLSGRRPLVIGGGVGVPPMLALTQKLMDEGKEPYVILGFNSHSDAFYIDKFEATGAEVKVTTIDGSLGKTGFVTDAVNEIKDYTFFYACGPVKMLSAICSTTLSQGQVSMEERMGCGFGACMGCSIETKNGNKRVCKEGPVFLKSEMIF